ncbi:MAG: HvfA family oxazolone/thioamide-modified RiPP metallophore [Woeseiaceae bacterium]
MSDKKVIKPIALAVGAALAGSFALGTSIANAETVESPFAISNLSSGYLLGEEGSCGGDKEGKEEAEGSCGEGSCGGDKEGEAEDKDGEGSCGEGSCGGDAEEKEGEGSCGEEKDAEGSCGEGSCGGSV